MRRNIDGTCSPSCCSNPNIRTINTMSADTVGNFTIRGDQGIHVTVGTNEIIISGIAMYYDNTDGNIAIDNDLLTINLADDITITGDMIIAGDLTVNGTYYTVHAEHVYTQDDYIILREGATTPLAAGSYAGFQVTKYDGTNDGRLVLDNAGVARVGDVGDEQPLLTRDEAADLTDGDILIWDGTNQKAIGNDAASVVIPPMNSYMNFQYASKSGFSIGVNSGQYPDAKVTLSEDGVYLLTMRVQFRVNASGDTITAFGFKIGSSEIYTNNVYPLNSTGLFRVATTVPFSITGAPVDVYPLVYRTSTGSATSTDTNAIIYSVRIG